MLDNSKLNCKVADNLKNVKLHFLIIPILLLLLISVYFLLLNGGRNFSDQYIYVQKDLFYSLNNKLSRFPHLQFNLTQLGDVLIFFPLITIFIIYAPKLWEALIISAVFSSIICAVSKRIFAIPRPALMFDNSSFTIIGKTLKGCNSLPSGHSIATFVVTTIVLFAFMPTKIIYKIIWHLFILTLGLFIAFSRVGVGAHYPLDVVIGCTIGYIVSIIGINITNRVNWFSWFKNKELYPIFILLFTIWIFVIIKKIVDENLYIFYFSTISLIITLSFITNVYVKRKN